MGRLRRLWRRLRAALRDDTPRAYCYFYTGTHTIRGFYLGRSKDGYVVAHAEVAPEGAPQFRQLRDTLVIPEVEFFTTDRPY